MANLGPSGGYNLKIVAAGPIDFGGWDVASGDVNHDGLDDIIVGTPGVSPSTITNTTPVLSPGLSTLPPSARLPAGPIVGQPMSGLAGQA